MNVLRASGHSPQPLGREVLSKFLRSWLAWRESPSRQTGQITRASGIPRESPRDAVCAKRGVRINSQLDQEYVDVAQFELAGLGLAIV